MRLRATVLREAIDDFAGASSDSTAELLDAYARDHFDTGRQELLAAPA